jgi:hypothetical protein
MSNIWNAMMQSQDKRDRSTACYKTATAKQKDLLHDQSPTTNPRSTTFAIHSLRLLPLPQRAPLFSNQSLDHLQALYIASVFVNALALSQHLLRLAKVVPTHGKVLPRLVFLVGGAECDMGFELVVGWETRGEEESQERCGNGPGCWVTGGCLLVG